MNAEPVEGALHYADATTLAGWMRAGTVSAREVVRAHLERIETVNPTVNAVVTLCADRAMEEAAAADDRLAAGEPVGLLHGLPVAVKDTHDTAGVRTTYGSPIFADHVPRADTLVVERMRAAGAIVIGKTNTPEFATGSHTFNPVFGVTRNPYAPTRSAGGSSGGAAAALASGMHPIADGSDMGGSLRNPASFTNVVGLRPTPGRVPSWPESLPWELMGTSGPMGRTVSDTALLLSALAGPDPRAPMSLQTPGSTFAASLDGDDTTGLRVAYSLDLGGTVPVEPEVATVVTDAAAVLSDLGCAVEEACPDLSGTDDVFRTLRAWLYHLGFGELIERHPGMVKSAVVDNAAVGRGLSGADIGRAKVEQAAIYHRVREFFGAYDALLLPVSQVAPFPAELEYPGDVAGQAMGDYLEWMASCCHVTVTACPAISVPGGFTPGGLPVGVQIVAPHRADLALLRYARAFERATGHATRRPPVDAPPDC